MQGNAHWYNMREEVLVYVNGRPLVLREDERPFKNMQVRAKNPAFLAVSDFFADVWLQHMAPESHLCTTTQCLPGSRMGL